VQFGKYDFHSVFHSDAILPRYKGSTFRGAFGVALKNVACALKHQDCPRCQLLKSCAYFRIFENAQPQEGDGNGVRPHPFVIEPPDSAKTRFSNGDEFNFSVLLFGFANGYLPYFVYAFEEMGKIGIGRLLEGSRPGYDLLRVTSSSRIVYEVADGFVLMGCEIDMPFDEGLEDDGREFEITIRIETPLRLKFQNKFHTELPFHILTRSMLRRISSLNNHFGNGEPNLDYVGLIKRASDVETIDSSLEWLDWTRFSNRQQVRMQLGGMVGAITYRGRLTEFLPLIRYSSRVHLGKATTFGLGKIEMIQDPALEPGV
jgi:CRISPR/Cas system endoribonuclease Cas6 (RAMP superfamily)